jgi:hypothetical protein
MENAYEIIEISEDAYKRNTVYRPWPDEKPGKSEDQVEVMPAENQRTASA